MFAEQIESIASAAKSNGFNLFWCKPFGVKA